MRTTGMVLAALLAAAVVAAPASAAPRGVGIYRVVQEIGLDEAQTGTFTLACRDGDVVTDGSWLAQSVDTSAQPDGGPYDLVTGLDVLAAEAFSASGYRFTLRNNSGGEARVRLDVTCLDRARRQHVHVSRLRSSTATLGDGLGGPRAKACPRGAIAIAAGFRIEAGLARPIDRHPSSRSLRRMTRTFAVLQRATRVRTTERCLEAGRLHMVFRARRVGLTHPGVAVDARVHCRRGELPLLGTFRLGGAWYLGQRPRARARDFRLQAAGPEAGSARLGVLCATA